MHRVHSGEPLRAWAGRPTGRLRRRSAGARFESEGVAVWRAAREPGSWSEGGAAFANRRRPSWGSFSASARASLAVAARRNGSSSRVRVWQAARSVFRARSSCAAASWSPSCSALASSQGRVVATNRLASSTSRHSAPTRRPEVEAPERVVDSGGRPGGHLAKRRGSVEGWLDGADALQLAPRGRHSSPRECVGGCAAARQPPSSLKSVAVGIKCSRTSRS